MRRGRGVTPPAVERSFGLPYTFGLFELSPLSRDLPGDGGRRGARQGASPLLSHPPSALSIVVTPMPRVSWFHTYATPMPRVALSILPWA